jgi:exopolysaccharide/PEP-CTERM locus tyrosine autokinase
MSLIEETLKRAKREATGPGVNRPRIEPAAPALALRASDPQPGKLAAKMAARPLLDIDRESLRLAGLIPQGSAERRLTSEYRAIKRALLAAMARRSGTVEETGNSVMVASAMPGEGKTFTSVNLAISLAAERDWTVVLIDADGAKRHLSSSLGLRDERGLFDVLSDNKSSLLDVAFRTNLPGLYVVPAGHYSDAATELMASARMAQGLRELLREDSRAIVLFDSSPILLTTESRALADVVGQVLLVVRADHTPRASVLEAIAALGEDHQIGVVLNEYQGTALQQSYYEDEDAQRARQSA